jgi:hypothetical protein
MLSGENLSIGANGRAYTFYTERFGRYEYLYCPTNERAGRYIVPTKLFVGFKNRRTGPLLTRRSPFLRLVQLYTMVTQFIFARHHINGTQCPQNISSADRHACRPAFTTRKTRISEK